MKEKDKKSISKSTVPPPGIMGKKGRCILIPPPKELLYFLFFFFQLVWNLTRYYTAKDPCPPNIRCVKEKEKTHATTRGMGKNI